MHCNASFLSNPIQCDMTGTARSSLPASQTTIYYIGTDW